MSTYFYLLTLLPVELCNIILDNICIKNLCNILITFGIIPHEFLKKIIQKKYTLSGLCLLSCYLNEHLDISTDLLIQTHTDVFIRYQKICDNHINQKLINHLSKKEDSKFVITEWNICDKNIIIISDFFNEYLIHRINNNDTKREKCLRINIKYTRSDSSLLIGRMHNFHDVIMFNGIDITKKQDPILFFEKKIIVDDIVSYYMCNSHIISKNIEIDIPFGNLSINKIIKTNYKSTKHKYQKLMYVNKKYIIKNILVKIISNDSVRYDIVKYKDDLIEILTKKENIYEITDHFEEEVNCEINFFDYHAVSLGKNLNKKSKKLLSYIKSCIKNNIRYYSKFRSFRCENSPPYGIFEDEEVRGLVRLMIEIVDYIGKYKSLGFTFVS